MGPQRIVNVPKELHDLMEQTMGDNMSVEVTVKPLYVLNKKEEAE